MSPIRVTCPTQVTIVVLITQIVGEKNRSWALRFFGGSCGYTSVMKKGAPNIKIMELWEDTECIINYFISPGIGI